VALDSVIAWITVLSRIVSAMLNVTVAALCSYCHYALENNSALAHPPQSARPPQSAHYPHRQYPRTSRLVLLACRKVNRNTVFPTKVDRSEGWVGVDSGNYFLLIFLIFGLLICWCFGSGQHHGIHGSGRLARVLVCSCYNLCVNCVPHMVEMECASLRIL